MTDSPVGQTASELLAVPVITDSDVLDRVAACQLEQHRPDLRGHVAAERAVFSERLNLRCNLRQARQTAPLGEGCH